MLVIIIYFLFKCCTYILYTDCIAKNIIIVLIISARSKQLEDKNKLGDLTVYPLDLCSLKSVKECAKMLLTKEPAIHILVNNAGIMFNPNEKTNDGFEIHLQSNYLGHFLLTLLLLPKMQLSAPGCRIVNVSSLAYICT